jgi:alpha-L-arabinofuranosidase
MMNLKTLLFTVLFLASFGAFAQKTTSISVNVAKPISEIQPTMWGIFFEDINMGADGGLYAEMIKNRSFEFDTPLMGWIEPNSDRHSLNEKSGIATPIKINDKNHFIKVQVNHPQGYMLINEGFRGMGIQKDAIYNLSFKAQKEKEGITKIKFQFVDAGGKVLGETFVAPSTSDWRTYTTSLVATTTELKAGLKITFEGTGSIHLDMISLFPQDTWKGRPNGLRKDLVQLLADLKPGFLRFPGGCIVEGRNLNQRYQWKKTVGDVDKRETLINRWNTEFGHRPTPDYFQTFGLGFFEYFQLSEDLGAEPLPILSCGMACQFNTGELVPMNELDPFIQDAMDLIEFANGNADTKWGKIRAEMGHPMPFNLKYIGVGNEQWGPNYFERLDAFTKVIKAKYPKMVIVSGTGPSPDGEQFDYAKEELKKRKAEIVDEHYYRSPQWFLENANRYDSYDRNSYKIFAGEYASQSVATVSPDNKNNWECALSEAAFMTGLERNAAVVHLTSYAPLFAHVDGWQWTPDLIWFDNLKSLATANYYVQKLFSNNRGTHVLPALSDNKPLTGQNKLYATAALDKKTNQVIVKLVNASATAQNIEVNIDGVSKLNSKANMTVLKNNDVKLYNTLENPNEIKPTEQEVKLKGKKLSVALAPYSLSVVVIEQ